ncbi:recombinase RecT [Paraburkholderia sp. 31.1]|uniref:recombinase RecT n=1 Tax=Paraburkholderia sp. 31.1 TaxID=2615205 RepID=UPI001655DDE4|nr:recombinase RecT [Paraburkholderia sp. 31.1]MBC8722103.1 recombinase RecT [Paraburkholderia sp. 31.1]
MSTDIQQVQSERFTLTPSLLQQVDHLADMMANGGVAVPEHLRGKKGACFALTMQAIRWEMDPFAVAAKTHVTKSGQLGYDGQLIAAVVIARAPIRNRPEYEFVGDWSKVMGKCEARKSEKSGGEYYIATYTKAEEEGLGVIVKATFRGETEPRTVQVMMSQAYPRFSTQWATDPQQQICFLAIRKWARRHTPDVLLGVYAPEELEFDAPGPRNMGPVDEVPREDVVGNSRTSSVKASMKKNVTRRESAPTLDEVLKAIADASSADELTAAGERATGLRTHQEKEIARTAYADKLNAARAARRVTKKGEGEDTGDGAPQAASADLLVAMTFAKVMDALEKADSPDVLDVAADLIRNVPEEEQRDELEEFYIAKRDRLQGA